MSDIPRPPIIPCSSYSMEEQDYWDRDRDKRANLNEPNPHSYFAPYSETRDDGRHLKSDGTWAWYKNHNLHRDDGPAILILRKHPSDELIKYAHIWVKNGIIHRDDGPAVVFEDGVIEWFIDGASIIPEGFRILDSSPWFESAVDQMIWLQQIERHRAELLSRGPKSGQGFPGSII